MPRKRKPPKPPKEPHHLCERCADLLLDRLEATLDGAALRLGFDGLAELLTALFPEECPATTPPEPTRTLPGPEKVPLMAERFDRCEDVLADGDYLTDVGRSMAWQRRRNGHDQRNGDQAVPAEPDETPLTAGQRCHLPRCQDVTPEGKRVKRPEGDRKRHRVTAGVAHFSNTEAGGE